MEEIFNKLEFDSAKLYKKNLLLQLDSFLKGYANKSILDMEADEANKAIADKLKACMKEETVVGCFRSFSKKYTDGMINIDYSDTIKNMVAKTVKNKD